MKTEAIKGIYCLVIDISSNINPEIGALGRVKLKRGTYVYVGSAQNNLKKRIQRHFSKNKKIRWHIDHLLASQNVKPEKAFHRKANKDQECRTAGFLSTVAVPIPGFGCSDCKCISHLFRVKSLKYINELGFTRVWPANG